MPPPSQGSRGAGLTTTPDLATGARSYERCYGAPPTDLWTDLDDRLDLDRRAERQLGDANGAAGMLPSLAENGPEQLRGAVDHSRLPGEPGRRGDEADHLDDLQYPAEADERVDRGQRVECAAPGQLLGRLRGHFGADLSDRQELAVRERQLPGDVHVRAGPDRGH